jgi:hypothetical protein
MTSDGRPSTLRVQDGPFLAHSGHCRPDRAGVGSHLKKCASTQPETALG